MTGSARGLGLAAAQRLSEAGLRVHVVWRSSEEQAASLEERFPGRVHRADLSEDGACAALIESVLAIDGAVSHLVHAVGDYEEGSLSKMSTAQLRALFQSNVFTAMEMADAARGALRVAARGEGDASMLFFGTAGLAGLGARTKTPAYAAAKSALAVLMRSLAREEAEHGVRVNMISPGLIPHAGAHPSTLDPSLHAKIPLGHAGTPSDVADGVHFLTHARHITGQDLGIDGGWLL